MSLWQFFITFVRLNPFASPVMSDIHGIRSAGDGLLLPLAESFYSVQGEGYNTGRAAWFIRLGGCDVHCPWCDSKGTWNPDSHPLKSVQEIIGEIALSPAVNVIITGGEPLMHNLDALCSGLKDKGYSIFLETSGTHPLSGQFDWICLSPKKHCPPKTEVLKAADEIKAVISSEEDFAWAESCRVQTKDGCLPFLQAEWSRRDTVMPLIIEYVKHHPVWRISLQTHKYMNIP